MKKNHASRIEFLDGLRGIAILLVIFFHAYCRWPEHISFVEKTKDIFIFEYGYLGVQLFFMISGFVIFMSLDRCKNIQQFIFKRWIRLFPAMLIATIFIYFTAPYFYERPAGMPNSIDVIPGLLFVSSSLISKILNIDIRSLEGSFWSLYVEVIFYFIAAFTYFKIGKDKLVYLIFAIFFIAFNLNAFYSIIGVNTFLISSLIHLGFIYYGWFIIGMIVYIKTQNNCLTLPQKAIFLFSIMTIFAEHDWGVIFASFLILGIFLLPFISVVVAKALSYRLFLFMGFVSYPLYLMHENIMVSTIVKILSYERIREHPIKFFVPLAAIALLIFLSWIVSEKLEPLIRNKVIGARELIQLKIKFFNEKVQKWGQ